MMQMQEVQVFAMVCKCASDDTVMIMRCCVEVQCVSVVLLMKTVPEGDDFGLLSWVQSCLSNDQWGHQRV